MQRLDFAQYGIDDLGDRFQVDPHPNDPYVFVPPVLGTSGEKIAATLANAGFQSALTDSLGPANMQEDHARERYIRACIIVTAALADIHPDLMNDI